ncbi:hypothetical protein ACFQ7O_01655 [Streptomyces sp. NPDC056485]|uniref:hypothetical protein n=1 Tax=Streptomyces sp. NPDC056485 TaxID=3345834 RepID=UPI00369905D4
MAEAKVPDGLLGLGGLGTGLADAIRAQATSQAKAAALQVEYDTLTDYQTMVKDLLDDLTGSHADHKKLADDTLPAGKLGTGFPEADALFKSYGTVITELQKLSKGLAGVIEAMGIAILSAGGGYGGVDEETQRRMVSLAKTAEAQYDPKRDPYVEEQRKLEASKHAGTGGDTKGGNY